MRKHLLLACFFIAILLGPGEARAQFTDPRTYTNVPTGTNQIELGYSYARGNASIDTALVIPGAEFNLNQGIINYTRNFGLLHRLMWAEASVPVAGLSGSIVGTNIQGTTIGAGDSSYQWGMLLKGGPALNTAQFNSYTPETTLGISLMATAPTGSYKSNKILNLGAGRWAFKTEIALKGTLAIPSAKASGCPSIRGTPFGVQHSRMGSTRMMHNTISSWAAN